MVHVKLGTGEFKQTLYICIAVKTQTSHKGDFLFPKSPRCSVSVTAFLIFCNFLAVFYGIKNTHYVIVHLRNSPGTPCALFLPNLSVLTRELSSTKVDILTYELNKNNYKHKMWGL